MGLSASCHTYAGGLVLVEPDYGYGWTQPSESSSKEPIVVEIPIAFHARVERLFEWQKELIGGLARVEQPAHVLNGLFLAFSLRHEGEYDFRLHPAHYNLSVGEAGTLTSNGWWITTGPPNIYGFGRIRDDERSWA